MSEGSFVRSYISLALNLAVFLLNVGINRIEIKGLKDRNMVNNMRFCDCLGRTFLEAFSELWGRGIPQADRRVRNVSLPEACPGRGTNIPPGFAS